MFAAFFSIIFMGHFYVLLMLLGVAARVFYELISLKKFETQGETIQISTNLSWYFFCVTIFYSLLNYFSEIEINFPHHHMDTLVHYKKTICFILYTAGMIIYIANLKFKHIRDQISVFFWTVLMNLYASIGLMGFTNIYEGLIWFLMPILLVTMNDTFALLGGKFFGRTQLWKLSPKKTVEGFIVGFLGTAFVGYLITKMTE